MKPDAICRLKAGCPLNFLEFHNTDEGFRHNNKEGWGVGGVEGQEAVGVKSGAADDSTNNILTLDRD